MSVVISIKDNRIRWAISAVLALLILFGTYRGVFSLAAFLLFALILVFCDRETNILQIFFVMPMANIFKMSPGVQSFFTIIILVYVVLHLVLPRQATLIVALFAVYVVVGQLFAGDLNVFRAIKLVFNLLFLSSILNKETKIRNKELFLSYIIGNLVASVFGLMDSSFFKIDSYIGEKALSGIDQEEVVYRFAGLYVDPNYYNVGIIISLCLIVILFYKKEINELTMALLSLPMIYFLILTYSKSALIMLLLPVFLFLYSLYRRQNHIAIIVFVLLGLSLVLLVFSGQIDTFDVVLERISSSETEEGMDVNALTTGRFDLWVAYIKFLINNFRIGIFGNSIAAGLVNSRASHNTYIDLFYYLGAIGTSLLIAILLVISKQSRTVVIKRNIVNYSVLICIVIMYFFLSELFYFDPPFHIYLAITVLNMSLAKPKKNSVNDC